MNKAYLLLENGMLFEGRHRGASGCAVGELVFNTGAAGYQGILTDPSSYGQMVCMTYPLIGNYGVNTEGCETQKAWVNGFIVRKMSDTPSNWKCRETLNDFLARNGVVALEGIDTRHLTRVLRDCGIMNCAIWSEDTAVDRDEVMAKIKAFKIEGAVKAVSAADASCDCEGELRVALLNFGSKLASVDSLKRRGCGVKVFAADTAAEEILAGGFDGVMLTGGPGDPAENTEIVENIKKLIAAKLPIFGVRLGHQLLSLAIGAETRKMQYGHHGANQPVKDNASGRTYITAQSHNYEVVADSVDTSVARVSHVNLNDGSVEGIELVKKALNSRYSFLSMFTRRDVLDYLESQGEDISTLV